MPFLHGHDAQQIRNAFRAFRIVLSSFFHLFPFLSFYPFLKVQLCLYDSDVVPRCSTWFSSHVVIFVAAMRGRSFKNDGDWEKCHLLGSLCSRKHCKRERTARWREMKDEREWKIYKDIRIPGWWKMGKRAIFFGICLAKLKLKRTWKGIETRTSFSPSSGVHRLRQPGTKSRFWEKRQDDSVSTSIFNALVCFHSLPLRNLKSRNPFPLYSERLLSLQFKVETKSKDGQDNIFCTNDSKNSMYTVYCIL